VKTGYRCFCAVTILGPLIVDDVWKEVMYRYVCFYCCSAVWDVDTERVLSVCVNRFRSGPIQR